MENSIETVLTVMQIYPYTNSSFHRLMGILTIFLIPAGIILFPFFVGSKLILYSLFYLVTGPIEHTIIYNKIWILKNYLLLPFHHLIYKCSGVFFVIWLNANDFLFDDYWFGLEKAKYKNHEHFRSSYRRAVTRRRFRQKLDTYNKQGIIAEEVKSRISFYKILFSYSMFRLIKESCFRKNGNKLLYCSIIREYSLLLLLPMNIILYKNNNKIVGMSSFLIRGNTLLPCQCIISSDYCRSGIYYKTMKDLMQKAFKLKNIRFISSGPTSNQAKQTCGFYPVNFLLTDEFKYIPFS